MNARRKAGKCSMVTPSITIEASGRCPTPERISQQLQEQLRAIQSLRKLLNVAVPRRMAEALADQLTKARGLPER
jgi:hypothetical protein